MEELTIVDYKNMDFDSEQLYQINEGLKAGIDVTIFAKKEYDGAQMQEIREGLISGVDVSIYANTKFSADQMNEIKIGLEQGVEVELYALEEYSGDDMMHIRRGLLNKNHWTLIMSYHAVRGYFTAKKLGYKVNRKMFQKYDYSAEDMEMCLDFFAQGLDPTLGGEFICLKWKLEEELDRLEEEHNRLAEERKRINICKKLGLHRAEYDKYQIDEIVEGYKENLPVVVYLNEHYLFSQMSGIRTLLKQEKYRRILLYLYFTHNMSEFVDCYYAMYDSEEDDLFEGYWYKSTKQFLFCANYLLEKDIKLFKKVLNMDIGYINVIASLVKKGFDVYTIIDAGLNLYGFEMIEKGWDVEVNLFPYLEMGWSYESLMNLIIMCKMGADTDEFINATNSFCLKKRKEYVPIDMEQKVLDYLLCKDIHDYDTPPLPTYFILSVLPHEYGPFEKFELTDESLYEFITTVEFREYCEKFYDDDDPSINNWFDSWRGIFGLRACYNDLGSFIHSGADLDGRVYKGVNSKGDGALFCFRRDFGGADYVVYFKERA